MEGNRLWSLFRGKRRRQSGTTSVGRVAGVGLGGKELAGHRKERIRGFKLGCALCCRYLDEFMKWLKWLLAVLSVLLVLALTRNSMLTAELRQTQYDVRYSDEYIDLIWAMRDSALKGDLKFSSKYLFELQEAPFRKYTPYWPIKNRRLQKLVQEEREQAIARIIDDLRVRTGRNLGERAGPWILEYGDADYKNLEKDLERH
jgi:hypothetical protein